MYIKSPKESWSNDSFGLLMYIRASKKLVVLPNPLLVPVAFFGGSAPMAQLMALDLAFELGHDEGLHENVFAGCLGRRPSPTLPKHQPLVPPPLTAAEGASLDHAQA